MKGRKLVVILLLSRENSFSEELGSGIPEVHHM